MDLIIFIIFFILILIIYILYIYLGKSAFILRQKDIDDYIKKVNNFININLKGKLINDKKNFKKSDNPKISVVITVHNGLQCLKTAVRSVQNQDFLDIEIIIVDDKSEDESLKLTKELMIEDPRIELIQNDKNRGALYTKAKGVLTAKGKYVILLDVDDLYAMENVFSVLYKEAEENNLDIVGFTSIQGGMNDNGFYKLSFHNDFETPIIYQPKLSERSSIKIENGEIIGVRDVLWAYFFRTDFYKKAISEIDEKFLNRINNGRDDILVFFLLVKKARSLKHINRILYVTVQSVKENNPLLKTFQNEKHKFRRLYGCWDNISYVELVLIKSNNNYEDKKIAAFAIKKFILNDDCGRKMLIRNETIKVCKLYLDNQYIDNNTKEQINLFLKSLNE